MPLVPYGSSQGEHGTQDETTDGQAQGEFDMNHSLAREWEEEALNQSPIYNQLSPISEAVHEVIQDIDDQFTPVNLTELHHTPALENAPPSTHGHNDVQGSSGQFLNPFS